MRASIALVALMLGCAHKQERSSWVTKTTDAEAQVLVKDIVEFVRNESVPVATILRLEPARHKNHVTPLLEGALGKEGFGIAAREGQGRALRYLVDEVENGLLLQVELGQVAGTRLYERVGGGASAVSPFAIRRFQ